MITESIFDFYRDNFPLGIILHNFGLSFYPLNIKFPCLKKMLVSLFLIIDTKMEELTCIDL